jgi:chitinase
MFDDMLKYRNDPQCPAVGFYTYNAFISAAKEFPDFGNTGDDLMRKREIAAFLGQTSHETTGRVLFFLYNFLLVTSINVI